MDWIAVGTLAASLIAAVGAVWAVVVSQRQLALAQAAAEQPHPIIEAIVSQNMDASEWTDVIVRVHNRAEIGIDLLTLTAVSPAIQIMPREDAYYSPESWTVALRDPIPEPTSRKVALDTRADPRADATVVVIAHCEPSLFWEVREPRLSLEMRWRDHTTKTFAMAVNVIKPNTR